jgi:ABC-2 type transport system permease protein
MNKILLVIEREYLVRVKKKSFIIMSLVGPILFALLFFVPILLFKYADKTEKEKRIAITKACSFTKQDFKDTQKLKFSFVDKSVNDLKSSLGKTYYAVLSFDKENKYILTSNSQVPISIESSIKNNINAVLKERKIKELNLDKNVLNQLNIRANVSTVFLNKKGKEEKGSSKLITGFGFVLAFIVYMFIFIYGAQVMRGVIEEKTNRIVEVVISSVKPFQLMMGKIIGVALVAISQVLIWIVLSVTILGFVSYSVTSSFDIPALAQSNPMLSNFATGLESFPIGTMLITFILYFIGGYLLYTSLFAAVGSAVDNETDTQQFMLPISIPLIIAFMMAQAVITNPQSSIAFWGSMVPFTSPIIMLIRIGFGVEWWELVLSFSILTATFVFTTWLASRIYRIGILMYGKKVSYKELYKWIRQSN